MVFRFARRCWGAVTAGSLAVLGVVAPGLTVMAVAGVCLAAMPMVAEADETATPPSQARHYRIAAGPLAPALNRFALEAGVVMYYPPELTEGRRTAGLQGRYTVEQGFRALLRDTGLSADREDGGVYTLTDAGAGAGVGARLERVTVEGEEDPRRDLYLQPGSVSIVTRQDIDRIAPRNTSDVLAAVPGVHTSQSRQDPGVSVNIRGLQDFGRVNVMIDGARQNYQQSGHGSNGQVYLDPELLAGVDVAKGPTSTVGGAGVIGGVVNFRTLEFEDLARDGADHGARINLTTGNNAYYFAGSVAAATRVTDNLDLLAAFSRKNVGAFDKGERGSKDGGYWHGTSQFTGQDQWSGLFKSTLRLGDDQRLKFSYIGLDAEFDQGSNTSVLAGATDYNRVRTDTFLFNYSLFPASSWLDLDSSLYYTRTANDQDRPDTGDGYGAFAVRYETNTVGGTLSNRTPLDLGDWPAALELSYGLEFYHDWTRPNAAQSGEGDGEPSWFSGPTPEGERSVASLFSQARFAHFSGLELIAGLRYDYFRLKGDGEMFVGSDQNPPGTRPPFTSYYSDFAVARHDGFVSPTLTVAWQITNPLQLFASYGRGVRPPAITESLMWGSHIGNSFPFFPNPGLEPERSSNWEVGANLRLPDLLRDGDRLRLKAAWFNTRVDHYITQAPVINPTSIGDAGDIEAFGFVNLDDEVRFRGLELQAEYDLGVAFAELSWTRTLHDLGRGGYNPYPLGNITGSQPQDGVGEPNGGGIIYLLPPRKKGTLSSGVRLFDRRLTLGARVRYEDNDGRGGTMYADVVDWTVYDLWASYQPSDALTLRLAVDNLRDRNYAELNGTSYWIAPGRTVTGTLSLRF
tara:strand:+ start:19263 stop:21830 length:2568 start_codon:yes stop_codon:yes gene_type:complete